MKSCLLLKAAIVGALAVFPAQAGLLTGDVAFGGVSILNNPVSALATQVSVPLAFGAAASGDFTPSIGVGTPIAFTSPIVFGVTSGLLWTGGAGPVFTFTSSSPVTALAGPNNTLSISSLGIVDDGPGGRDPADAIFSMAITPTPTGFGAFGAVTTTSVPEPTTWAMVAGLSLLGFAAYRRVMGYSAQ